ncbi:MAG: hypothetical protein P8I29_07405 [Flavobacteriales bacterium]|jgi:hypothetical protein|nr:hypothetical protein [Flavobacteriales bacterium]|tara:strand:+ start:2369 stop:2641 length:273 start_codon:yes stop_codon:yes gene_type:complete
MYKTFTQNDLIRFLYNEMNSEESILLKDALLNDAELCATYHKLKSSMDLLDAERYSLTPSDFSLAKIKSYARGFSSKPSKYLNRIDLVLN